MKRKVVIKIYDLECLEVVIKPSKIYGGNTDYGSKPSSGGTIGSNIPSGLWSF
jgi:hypothetical protein